MQTPEGKAKFRNPLERIVLVSSAQARGKLSCFAEYQPHIELIIDHQKKTGMRKFSKYIKGQPLKVI